MNKPTSQVFSVSVSTTDRIPPMMTISLAKQIVGPKRRPMVNSWDVFDTLISRFYPNPIDTFRLVEQRVAGSNFLEQRLQAQNDLDRIGTPYVVNDIYRRMVANGMQRPLASALLALELRVEQELLFPIRAVVEMVEPGDIIISDMYLPEDVIFDLVRDLCGLQELRPIVRSNWGKASGTIWAEVLGHYAIRTHFGDNPRSDIEMPGKFGIEASLVDNAKPTAWEHSVAKLGLPHLALVLRETRLRGVTNDAGPTQTIIAGPYLALLYGFSVWLAATFGDERRYIFLRRDADGLARIFGTLYPAIEWTTLDLSREMVLDQGFDGVLMSRIDGNSILVDPLTSGRTVSLFLERNGDQSTILACLVHLDRVTQSDVGRVNAMTQSGRIRFITRRSDLPNHHYILECLLQTLWPPVTSLSHDARSGGYVRSFGASHDLTPGERRLINAKLNLVTEFTACLRRRGSDAACDADKALTLIKASLSAIIAENELIAAFPSFLIRERI
jgi:hypothetical protein